MISNTCIPGGEGFIGRHLAECLSRRGCAAITSIDLVEGGREFGAARRYLKGDVRDAATLPATPGCEAIFNLAAVHRTPGHPAHEYFEANVFGAENVCDLARRTDTRTIVFASSIAPYGASEALKTEETLPTPNTPYGISKLIAEHIHRTWQAEDAARRRLVIVRPGVVFGKGEGGNVTRLYWALRRKRFAYPGRKDTVKACIYVKDLARLLVEMAERTEPGVFVYNMTYEPAPGIEQICAALAKVTGVTAPKLVIPGAALKAVATVLGAISATGLAGEGVHPDRVKKLMVSNNISGAKLVRDGYRLEFSLEEAFADWWRDCGGDGLT
jgi:GlcNAc-P-P-Und epimerase